MAPPIDLLHDYFPLVLTVGATLFFAFMVFGFLLFFQGTPLLLVSVLGYVVGFFLLILYVFGRAVRTLKRRRPGQEARSASSWPSSSAPVSDATFPPQQAVAGHNGRYVQISREEEAQLNASDQGAANLRLLAMLHDVRNHLQVILGGAEFLLEHRDEPEAAEARILHQIQRNALNGSLLLATYFNTVRIETGRFSQSYQPLDVNALLRRVVQQWETEAQHKQLQLELHFPRRLPSLVGDFAALTLVFSNLLHNAYKFTPPYGRVTLRAAWDDQEVAVSCEDTGCGIVSADLERIFEKTTRAGSPDAPKGTGLGLFIVQTIVAEHAGRVVVHSTPGQGSRFTVYLPRPYAS